MRVTIDRIEDNIAVLITDNGQKIDAPLSLFSNGKEGEIYEIKLDENEMQERKSRIEKLAEEIWE